MTQGNPQHEQILTGLLAWYREIGVDEVLAETPIDWLARGDASPGQNTRISRVANPIPAPDKTTTNTTAQKFERSDRNTSGGPPSSNGSQSLSSPAQAPRGNAAPLRTPQQPVPAPIETLIADATAQAKSAQNLEQLGKAIASFNGCGLKATAKSACVFRGAEAAHLMVIGEAPGRDEDLAGKPFVGRAGQLLDKMLAAIEIDETNVHITNTVYWRPPGNRTPTPQEIQVCRPFLERQIELVRPTHLMLLGGAAAKSIFDTTEGIMRLRGKWQNVSLGNATLPALATLHPAYLLRTPAAKRLAWHDLTSIKQRLNN